MAQYIEKSALVAEIESKIKEWRLGSSSEAKFRIEAYKELSEWLDTLEVKDANEALRTEYEKGRADVIQATEQWLANSWPKYCETPNIIKAFKENVIED